jgi:hypothetical protein
MVHAATAPSALGASPRGDTSGAVVLIEVGCTACEALSSVDPGCVPAHSCGVV